MSSVVLNLSIYLLTAYIYPLLILLRSGYLGKIAFSRNLLNISQSSIPIKYPIKSKVKWLLPNT
ncbi:MAG: hypothetical protein AAFX80_24020, partial [Cyanobacteria bacterium J06639_18]